MVSVCVCVCVCIKIRVLNGGVARASWQVASTSLSHVPTYKIEEGTSIFWLYLD